MSVIHNLIAKYRLLNRRQKIFVVGVGAIALLALLQWLSGGV